MKKAMITALMSLTVVTAGAQTMYDGLTFSQNDYYGTARSIGMGNAMTAVGGDLGSVGINPAGSAVAGYSQFTITPNLTISSMNSSYSATNSGVYVNGQNTNLTRFSIPNFGLMVNWDTGSRSGLTAITYGIVFNGTNNFTGHVMGGGTNSSSSYLGALASAATGYDIDYLNGYQDETGGSIDQWDYAYYNPDSRGYYAPWNVIANAQAGSISNFGSTAEPDYYWRYIGATEAYTDTGMDDEAGNYIYKIYIPGTLNQSYGRKVTGSKYDAIANVGLNFGDTFYLGGNLGLTSLRYDTSEYIKEAAEDPSDFPLDFENNGKTYFDNYRGRYSYSATGSGIYGKIGFIWKPVDGPRVGGAFQTPTTMEITERWLHVADITYTSGKTDEAKSPEGEYTYRLRTPYRVNAGLAFTFAGMAMVSADYEMTDYSKMKFLDKNTWETTFDDLNQDIADCMGISHTVRIGAEFKPMPEIAVRAGYNFTVTPEYSYFADRKSTTNDKVHSYSVGLGYSSEGSFFADIAARLTTLADEYIYLYDDYLDEVASPVMLNKRQRFNITATFGWRF